MPLPNTGRILAGPGPSQHYVFKKHFVLFNSSNKMIIDSNNTKSYGIHCQETPIRLTESMRDLSLARKLQNTEQKQSKAEVR